MTKIKVRIRFTEEVLGTSPNNSDLYADYIASKAPDAKTMEEEIAEHGEQEVMEKGMTVFDRTEDGEPFLYDYQVKGFFKGACGFLRNVTSTESAKLKNYKKKLDGLLFIFPRKIKLELPEGKSIGTCTRPLRASTAQGERIALSHSEAAPEGTEIFFTIKILDDSMVKLVDEILEYGELSGIGQWRNSGKGRFEIVEKTVE